MVARCGGSSSVALVLLVTIGCAPPALPDELQPRIEIIAPVSDSQVPLVVGAGTCDLDIVVAVDIDNFTIVPVGTPVAEGEGHWHIELAGREDESLVKTDDAQSTPFHVENLVPGVRATIVASLHDSEHGPIEGDFTVSQIEFDLVDPEGTASCP